MSLIPIVELFASENSIWHFEDWVHIFWFAAFCNRHMNVKSFLTSLWVSCDYSRDCSDHSLLDSDIVRWYFTQTCCLCL